MSSKTTRRSLLSALGPGVAARANAAPATPDRPNILFIYMNDHSYRTLSCYPETYPGVRTRNIDRLAAQGVQVTAACKGALCMQWKARIPAAKLRRSKCGSVDRTPAVREA